MVRSIRTEFRHFTEDRGIKIEASEEIQDADPGL